MPTTTANRRTLDVAEENVHSGKVYFESDPIEVDSQTIIVRIMEITAVRAGYLLEHFNKANRPFSSLTIDKLVRDMNDGSFRFNGDTICRDTDGNLIDGQNRLRAITVSGKPQTMMEITGFEPVVMNTKDLGKARSVADILIVNGCIIRNTSVVVSAASILLLGSKRLHSQGTDRKRVAAYVIAHRERLEETAAWAKHTSTQSDLIRVRTSNRRVLSPAPLAALSIVMENQGATQAEVRTFFEALASGTIPPHLGVVTAEERFEIIAAARQWLRGGYQLVREGGTQFPVLLQVMATLIVVFNKLKHPENANLRQIRLMRLPTKHYDSAAFPKAL